MADTTFIDGDLAQSNRVVAAWLNDVNNLRYGASNAARGAALLQFLQNDTTAGVRTAQSKMRDFAHIDDFSPAASGDNLTALTKWVNSGIANPGVPHYLGNRNYSTSDDLPQITVSGVKLLGSGPSSNHDSGDVNCSRITKIGAAGGNILTVAPVSDASNQRLDGIVIDGIAFNGGQLAARGLTIKSVRNSFFNVYAEECTTSCFELDVVASLVDARDLQDCVFQLFGRDLYSGGAVVRLLGDVGANVSLNIFNIVDIVQSDEIGIICQNPDNNVWNMVRVFYQPGGAATYSIEWQGGASQGLASRWEKFNRLTATKAPVARGTGTYTYPATSIMITTLDAENGTPAPVVETGASVAGPQIAWTPTITSSSGTITTTSATALYRIDPNDPKVVNIRLAITMTNNGTGAGVVQATLPFPAANDAVEGVIPGREGVTSKALVSSVQVTLSLLRISFYDATYPGATGNVLTITGTYRRV